MLNTRKKRFLNKGLHKSNNNDLSKLYFLKCSDLSVYNWRMCLDGDLTYMRKEVDSDYHTPENDAQAWYEFLANYYEVIGASESQMELMQLKHDYAYAIATYLEATDDEQPFYYNDVELAEEAYLKFIKKAESQTKIDILDSLIAIEGILKQTIDEKTTSVEKFNKLIKKAQNGKTV